MTSENKIIPVEYFTDMLCIWAYGAQIRIDQLQKDFPNQLQFHYRFIPLFGATQKRIGQGWKDKGGFEGFGQHMQEVAQQWDHIDVHADVWASCRPASSIVVHLFLKAIQLQEQAAEINQDPISKWGGKTLFEAAMWLTRERFFKQACNICQCDQQRDIATELGLNYNAIKALIDNGEAYAALHLDHEAQAEYQVPGSPTLIMNAGRQRLYGNVGYRILKANVEELLHDHHSGEASWC